MKVIQIAIGPKVEGNAPVIYGLGDDYKVYAWSHGDWTPVR